jgi:hypothetical protein
VTKGRQIVGIFQRGERLETATIDELDVNSDETRRELRDEVDVDPLIEEATDRLREELRTLIARDEWGRELPWRHVARIALGPVLTRLRDQETTIRLLEATRQAPDIAPEPSPEDHILVALEEALEQAPPVEIVETPAATEDAVPVIEQSGPTDAPADPISATDDVRFRWS